MEKVHAGVMTSSPGFKFAMCNARILALLPLLQKIPNFLLKYLLTIASNSAVLGPGASQPSRKHASTASISSSSYASNLFGAYHIAFTCYKSGEESEKVLKIVELAEKVSLNLGKVKQRKSNRTFPE